MQIRNPAVAGAFYPFDSNELKSEIEKFFSQVKTKERDILGLVAPHAGYVYCGRTAASVYKAVARNFDVVVILGPSHYGFGGIAATSSGAWKTPLGTVDIDNEFAKELIKDSVITEDFRANLKEHSIEVQLPWLQYKFKNFKFVPVCINPIYFDAKTCKEIGNKIADVSKKLRKKTLIIASSDFTHYGSMYGNQPFHGTNSQILKRIKEMDLEAIDYVTKLMPERLIEFCENKTICGYGAIASMLFAAKILGAKKGELMDYSTSFDISKDSSAIVAYCGLCIH